MDMEDMDMQEDMHTERVTDMGKVMLDMLIQDMHVDMVCIIFYNYKIIRGNIPKSALK